LRSTHRAGNVANGFEALGSNTTGENNTAIGSLCVHWQTPPQQQHGLGRFRRKRRYDGQ